MKSYRVHFSFYSECDGNFDESIYTVNAESVFEARQLAWVLRDKDDSAQFQSCVKQCGVTWEASPLDLCDYLNSLAALYKLQIRIVEHIRIPNAGILRSEEKKEIARDERRHSYGELASVVTVARDIGKPFGMVPPDVLEEIAYAWLIVGKLDEQGKHEQAQALVDIIEKASAWDASAVRTLRDSFVIGSIYLVNGTEYIDEYFGRDGIYPERDKIHDYEVSYISRWDKAPSIDHLSALPPFDGRHIIKGSHIMPYNDRTLVLRHEVLPDAERTVENLLWTANDHDNELGDEYTDEFTAENLITGEHRVFTRDNFIGVLRPEFNNGIDYDALKQEYQKPAAGAEWYEGDDQDDEEDWEQEE